MKKLVISIIILIVSVDLISCSNQVTHKSDISSILSDSSVEALQNTNSSMKDSITSRKAELTKIYSKAIAEYIRAVYKNDKTVFDTLFFGKHVYGQAEDFPDIELPGTIENTRIKLVSPQIGLIIQRERNCRVYINMMGWVDKTKAEFILVTFSNGFKHKFDCHIAYKYSVPGREFELEKLRLEYFNNAGKIDHISDYIDGKFVKDKSIEETKK